MRALIAILAVCAGLGPAVAHAAVLSVPGDGAPLLAGDAVLHLDRQARPVSTAFPAGPTRPVAPFTAASATWIADAANTTRPCCKGADVDPVRATVAVRRADGSGGRDVAQCERGDAALATVREAVLLFSMRCPGGPARLQVSDLAAGTPPRTLVELPPGATPGGPLLLSGDRFGYVVFVAGRAVLRIGDLATGAPVRELTADGLRSAVLLDDGTVVITYGAEDDCRYRVEWIAPDGDRQEGEPACGVVAGTGDRIAYERAPAGGDHEIVVAPTPDGPTAAVVARLPGAGMRPASVAFDGRRIAWTQTGCAGQRVLAIDVPAADAAPYEAHAGPCPWRTGRTARLRADGRLRLPVTCPRGCRLRLVLSAADRRAGRLAVQLEPGRHVVALPLAPAVRAVLRRDGRLAARIRRAADTSAGRPITLLAR